jgi:hypothetical protein
MTFLRRCKEEVEVQLQLIRSIGTTSGYVVSKTPRFLYPGKRTETYRTGCWLGLVADLDGSKNLVPTEI